MQLEVFEDPLQGKFFRFSVICFKRYLYSSKKKSVDFFNKDFLLGVLEQFMTEIKHNAGVFSNLCKPWFSFFWTFVENFLEHLHRFDQILKSGMNHLRLNDK